MDVAQLMTGSSGAIVPVGGGAPIVNAKGPAPFLMSFRRGKVGFLQWYAKAYPAIYRLLARDRPDLLKAAAQGTSVGNCARAVAGLAGFAGTSWYDDILSYTSKALNLYGQYKQITSGQTSTAVQQQVQQQVQNAQANLPPQQLGPVSASTAPPSAQTVTTPGHAGAITTLAVVGVGGLALAKVFHLF